MKEYFTSCITRQSVEIDRACFRDASVRNDIKICLFLLCVKYTEKYHIAR